MEVRGRKGRVLRRYDVIVGKPSTPTPHGLFFVSESLRLHNDWARGKWALATSAFSEVLQEYDGGQGQVALHAKGTLAGALGSASSHGCIRFVNEQIARLVKLVPNGTPIIIEP